MAKTQVVEWKAFIQGEVKPKTPVKQKEFKFNWTLAAAAVIVGMNIAHGIAVADPAAIPAMASAAGPTFQQALSAATKPIKDLIYGFGHEIYGIFMAWGAIEVMIGKASQGFNRMKTATLAYVLLWWVPWITNQVDIVRPR